MACSGCGGARVTPQGSLQMDVDDSADFIVTYPNGVTKRVWGEGAALSEVANYPDASYEKAS